MESISLPAFAVLAFAVAAVSLTVTRSSLFAPWRGWLDRRRNRFWKFLDKLFSCPYCFSHWVAVAAACAFARELVGGLTVGGAIVSAFALVGLSALVIGVAQKLRVVGTGGGYVDEDDDEDEELGPAEPPDGGWNRD
ncbi:hypothetical protein ACFL26_01975 [Patescibacteria group bacterium]